jgi:hypothetical protein
MRTIQPWILMDDFWANKWNKGQPMNIGGNNQEIKSSYKSMKQRSRLSDLVHSHGWNVT